MKKLITSGFILAGLTMMSTPYAQIIKATDTNNREPSASPQLLNESNASNAQTNNAVTTIISTFLLDEPTTSTMVTNGNDSGIGSLRQALSDNAANISIDSDVTSITIFSTLEYNGTNSVQIIGLGTNQIIDASGLPEDSDILSINQGASLSITNLALTGNIDEFNDNPNNPNNGTGIFVNVPNTQSDTVAVILTDISISNVGSHGVHVSDCAVRDQCVEGQGSPASVSLEANNVTIDSVGIGRQDGDGIRLDERGEGSITFIAQGSTFINVGADGVELDEGDNGDITANIDNSVFDNNGEFCNFADDIDDTPCDNDGDPDLDDGFDIDEIGSGSILVTITNSQFINNFDEGLDFDEEDGGNIEITVTDSLFQNNGDQGIRASEEGDGNVEMMVSDSSTLDNGEQGVRAEEESDGDVLITFQNVTFGGNRQEDEGVRIEEEDDGDLSVSIFDSTVIDPDDEGLRIEESNSGSGTLEIRNSNFTEFELDNVERI